MLRKSILALYILIIVCMGLATFIEKGRGSQYVGDNIYGSWWFAAAWAVLAAAAVAYFIRRRVRNMYIVALHLSFVIILAGALLTHVTSRRGMIHLREGEAVDTYQVLEDGAVEVRRLPFTVELNSFRVIYYEGTAAAADYETRFTITDGEGRYEGLVSMNNIYTHRGYRLCQSDYDEDMRGSILSMNADPWGIPVTYLGYALLFVSLVWMLADPKGTYRRLLGSSRLKAGALTAVSMICAVRSADAATVLPEETAARFGRLYILHKDRVCPVQTFAIDFTKKLCGKASYKGYTAEQVLTGFMFHYDEWSREPIIRIKDGEMREALQLPEFCSVGTFFNSDMGGYIIGPYVRESYMGNRDKFHREVAETDDRLMMIMELRRGTLLKIFPYTCDGVTTWYAPTDKPAADVRREQGLFMGNALALLGRAVGGEGTGAADAMIEKMLRYQMKNGGLSLPSETRTTAERIYNRIPFATILFMLNLTMGLLTLAVEIRRMMSRKSDDACGCVLTGFPGRCVMLLSFAALTFCEALRWIVSGTIPMSNGYETMLFVAWTVMLLSLIACRRFPVALPFGFIMSGFFLLVSHIGQMNPDISHVTPVLNSPLLSIHVSVIMISFALLALTFICGVTALIIKGIGRKSHRDADAYGRLASLQLLSRLFLYPALTTLGIGIFIGAVWANVSWGQYWGWDPKEVWALITFMVYAVAVHTQSLPAMNDPLKYHIFITVAFLTVLMTYFGVNYVLGGMHSYA